MGLAQPELTAEEEGREDVSSRRLFRLLLDSLDLENQNFECAENKDEAI